MNLVGKIFIVLILLMSFVFMGFAIAVYATHHNWELAVNRQKGDPSGPPGLKLQLEEARTKRTQLEAQLALLTEQHATELAARQEALTKVTTEVETLRREHEALVNEHAKLVQQAREAVAAMEANHTLLAKMRRARCAARRHSQGPD